MAKTLDEIKEKLSQAFDAAVEKGIFLMEKGYTEVACTALRAAAETAKALTALETEQRQAKESHVSRIPKQ